MSESAKIETNKGCKYVFQQGDKKGEVCGISCRGDLCFKHNPKTKQKQKEYYIAKKQVPEEEPEEVNTGCKYLFIQGPNKGKPCRSNCRGDYCHQHKAGVKNKKHEYYETHAGDDKFVALEKKLDEMVAKEQDGLGSLVNKEKLKMLRFSDEAKILIRDVKHNKILLDSPNPTERKRAEVNLQLLYRDKDKLIKKLRKQKKIVILYEQKNDVLRKKLAEREKKEELKNTKLKK